MKGLTGKIFIFWFPVIIYCVIIFVLSSIQHPLPEDIKIPQFDKLLHAVEYGVLCYLLIRALAGSEVKLTRRAIVVLAVIAATLYGATDEFHQSFVPGRSSDFLDLLSDFIGAMIVGFIKR